MVKKLPLWHEKRIAMAFPSESPFNPFLCPACLPEAMRIEKEEPFMSALPLLKQMSPIHKTSIGKQLRRHTYHASSLPCF